MANYILKVHIDKINKRVYKTRCTIMTFNLEERQKTHNSVSASLWLASLLGLYILVCLRCNAFSDALLTLPTESSPWSSRIAVPLPFLVRLY